MEQVISRVGQLSDLTFVVWSCLRPGCDVTSRVPGRFCRACGAERQSEPVGEVSSVGPIRFRDRMLEDWTSDRRSLDEKRRVRASASTELTMQLQGAAKLMPLDDGVLARTGTETCCLALGDYEVAPPEVIRFEHAEADARLNALNLWMPPVLLRERAVVVSRKSIWVAPRSRFAALAEPRLRETGSAFKETRASGYFCGAGPYQGAGGDSLLVVEHAGPQLRISSWKDGNQEHSEILATLEPRGGGDLHWVAFFGAGNERQVSALLLGLRLVDGRPEDMELVSSARLSVGSAGVQFEDVPLADALADTRVLLGYDVCGHRNQLHVSAQVPSISNSPQIMRLTSGTSLSATPLRDADGHPISFGATIGLVEHSIYRAFGVGGKKGVQWVPGTSQQAGAGWSSADSLKVAHARFGFDGALGAGVVVKLPDERQRSRANVVLVDFSHGPHSAEVEEIDAPELAGVSLQAVSLRHDCLWVLYTSHGKVSLRWYYLPRLMMQTKLRETQVQSEEGISNA